MHNHFEEALMKDIYSQNQSNSGNLIRKSDAVLKGMAKVTVEEDEFDDVKIFLKKDSHDNLKEIKFVCSCGQTKNIILDYTD